MAKTIFDIDLCVNDYNRIESLIAKQYDKNSRFIRAHLYQLINGKREYINLKDDSIVWIRSLRADGESRPEAGYVENGKAVVPISAWLAMLDGIAQCDIRVEENDDEILSTTIFTITFQKAMDDGEQNPDEDVHDTVFVSLVKSFNKQVQDIKNEIFDAYSITNTAINQAVSATSSAQKYMTQAKQYAEQAAESTAVDTGIYVDTDGYISINYGGEN